MNEKRINILDLQNKKKSGHKIILLTAYDYPMARFADEAGVDIILVSDALGMVGLGYNTTLPVTLDEIIHHTKAVIRGTKNSIVIASMPFMSFSVSIPDALENSGRLIKETGANGIEVEGGFETVEIVEAISTVGIPVLSHIGLTRKYMLRFGKFRVQGKNVDEATKLIQLAPQLKTAGAFAILIECIPDRVAKIISETSEIPVIGIGSGPYCDGQALVSQDMLGLFEDFVPKFVKRYGNLAEHIRTAFRAFKRDVESSSFPTADHSFDIKDLEFEKLRKILEEKR
jgi:3-methyl-2-oxobutanoate hydroxymethyltransferase